MATDTPPTSYTLEYAGSGNVQVFPLFGTQILGTQIGSDVGTGGPALANLETVPTTASNYSNPTNRVVEFLDDVYCVAGWGAPGTTLGIYKQNQGGSGAWGRVHTPTAGFSAVSGLHIMHPNDVPTLVLLSHGQSDGDVYLHTSTNGTTWNETNVFADASPSAYGMSLAYRDILFWINKDNVFQYNFGTTSLTRAISGSLLQLPSFIGGCIHIHNNTPYAIWNNSNLSGSPLKLFRYSAGTFGSVSSGEVYNFNTQATPTIGGGTSGVMFTDFVHMDGDLIAILNASSTGDIGTHIFVINTPEGTVSTTNISSTVFGATHGADTYLVGGGGADATRRWTVYVDNDSDPTNPRTYLYTWVSGGGAQCWQWMGKDTEVEQVSLSTISGDNFVRFYSTRGGGNYFVGGGAPRAELGDSSNPPVEVDGGTKWFFRVYGTGGPAVMTLYYNNEELSPDSIATLTGSVTVESGTPSTTPSRSGNTITNLTADDGATLYSFIHDASADGLGEGETYTLMPDIV
jgi:hypothetical protein